MAIVTAFLIFMYATTFGFYAPIWGALSFLLAGLFLASLWVGVKFYLFSVGRLLETILWTATSFLIIHIVNQIIPLKLGAVPIDERLVAVLMGIAEEVFFRLWLLPFIEKITQNSLLALGVSSLIWTVYHIARYGASFNSLMLVFICGLGLGMTMLMSRKADPVIFAHGLVNYFAFA